MSRAHQWRFEASRGTKTVFKTVSLPFTCHEIVKRREEGRSGRGCRGGWRGVGCRPMDPLRPSLVKSLSPPSATSQGRVLARPWSFVECVELAEKAACAVTSPHAEHGSTAPLTHFHVSLGLHSQTSLEIALGLSNRNGGVFVKFAIAISDSSLKGCRCSGTTSVN